MKKTALVLAVLMAVTLVAGCSRQKEEELVMGFVPMKDAESLVESVEPLAELLSEELGIKVKPFTAVNYVAVVEGLGSGQVDFGFIPPFSYVLANSESNARVVLSALRRDGSATYKAQFVVRADSDIHDLDDLAGKKIAFVDPASTSGYLYPAAQLIGLGYDLDKDFETVFAGGHDKALQAVLNGDVDMGVMFVDARQRYGEDFPGAMEETRIIAYTQPIPSVSITVRGDMDGELSERIASALLAIAEDPEALKMLQDLFDIHGFARATDKDYQVVREVAQALDVDLMGE
jgi:phosphonate transport system substrate-binding protein